MLMLSAVVGLLTCLAEDVHANSVNYKEASYDVYANKITYTTKSVDSYVLVTDEITEWSNDVW